MSDQSPISMSEVPESTQAAANPDTLDSVVDEIVGEPTELDAEASDSEDEGESVEAASTEAIEEEIKALKKKLKLKIDGQEVEEEVDLNDEEALVREFQKAKAFDKRSQEYASLKKQVTGMMDYLKQNPVNALTELGINFEDLVNQFVEDKLAEAQKTPEQLAQEQLMKEVEELRKQKQAMEEKAQAAEMEKLRNQYASDIENGILKALESDKVALPSSPLVVKRIAETMLLAMQNGYANVQPADVIPVVEAQFKEEFQQMFGKMPEDVLETMVGKSNFERVRKKRVASRKKVKTETAKQITKETGIKNDDEEESKPKRSYRDFFSILD